MTNYLNSHLNQARIDDLHAQAERRRLAKAARGERRGLLSRLRRQNRAAKPAPETAEWWGAAATAPGRRLPA